MDRISSCATSSSSKMRISLLIPSRVANLSAMEKYMYNKENKRGVEGNSNLYCFLSIIEVQRSLTSLGGYNNFHCGRQTGKNWLQLLPDYFIWVRCRVAVDFDDLSVDQNDPPVLGFEYRGDCNVQSRNLVIV